MCHLAVETRLW